MLFLYGTHDKNIRLNDELDHALYVRQSEPSNQRFVVLTVEINKTKTTPEILSEGEGGVGGVRTLLA